jgi:hypothetical protein
MPDGLQNYLLTDHAREEMQRRGISETIVDTVLRAPGQRQTARPGRDVFQSLIDFGDPPTAYIVRVFVDIDRAPAEVVTVYRSSKASKYWR